MNEKKCKKCENTKCKNFDISAFDISAFDIIESFLDIQRKDISKDKGLKVRIDPESYVAKEIIYQTALLQVISRDIREIKRLLLKSNHDN